MKITFASIFLLTLLAAAGCDKQTAPASQAVSSNVAGVATGAQEKTLTLTVTGMT